MTGYYKVVAVGCDLRGHECRRGGAVSGASIPPERRISTWVYPYGSPRARICAQAQAQAQHALVRGSRKSEVRA